MSDLLATLERVRILDQAEELAAMILESDLAENYFKCFYKLRSSEESQKKIRDFVKIKERYEEVQRFGAHHPDYKEVMQSVWKVKRTMDLDQHVAEFKKAETQLQMLLDEISAIIGHSVSKNIKVPANVPFGAVSSRCGSCGSGGCR